MELAILILIILLGFVLTLYQVKCSQYEQLQQDNEVLKDWVKFYKNQLKKSRL